MKNSIIFLLCLFVSTLAKCQISQTPPTVNLTGVPFDIAFSVKKMILTEYLNKNQNPTGEDKVLLDDIDSQINRNGLTASTKTYRLNNLAFKYTAQLYQVYVSTELDNMDKIQKRWATGKPLLRQIKAQRPQMLRQLYELNRAGSMRFEKLDSLVTN
jgi:hypothetical protein